MATIYDYKQFITYRLVPNGGKYLKQPYNAATGQLNQGYHSGEGWMTYQEACTVAQEHNLGVGFVFTANDPFFFVDLDGCATPEGTWSDFAQQVLNMFPGAMVELSVSGTGLHIVGQGQAPVGHRNKDQARGLEIYTQLRFMAMGTGAVGDSSTDHTASLNALIATMPNGGVAALKDIVWTDKAVDEWSGPEDDDKLIEMMLASANDAKAEFLGKCNIRQLWERDEEALRRAYPDTSARGFDWSAADAALISHLAWWTGKNCARIDRLFRRSKLYREDKWGDRPDYAQRTVGGAVSMCKTVLQSGGGTETTDDGKTIPKLGTMWADQQEEFFKGCVYVRSEHKVFVPDTGELLTEAQFKASYGGYEFVMDGENRKTKNAFECFTTSRLFRFPKVHKTCFRPETGTANIIKQGNLSMVNMYVPPQVDVTYGDVSPFIDLMNRILPDQRDREIILSYAAAIVQYPGSKFQWTPVLQGTEGNGKSFLIRALSYAVGEQYAHLIDPENGLTSQFNKWLGHTLFVGVEEIYVRDRREVMDGVKAMITNERTPSEAKGKDQSTADNRANFFCCTNHKDAIIIKRGNRRWAIFYTAQQSEEDIIRDGMGGDYFPKFYQWAKNGGYADVAGYLKNYQIKDEYNPATQLHRAPETSSTNEAMSESLGAYELEVLEAIEDGSFVGMKMGWVSSTALQLLFTDRIKRNVSVRKRGEIISNLGYIKHPALRDGRCGSPLFAENNTRPILYVHKNDDRLLAITDGAMAQNVYCNDQGYASTPSLTVAAGTGT